MYNFTWFAFQFQRALNFDEQKMKDRNLGFYIMRDNAIRSLTKADWTSDMRRILLQCESDSRERNCAGSNLAWPRVNATSGRIRRDGRARAVWGGNHAGYNSLALWSRDRLFAIVEACNLRLVGWPFILKRHYLHGTCDYCERICRDCGATLCYLNVGGHRSWRECFCYESCYSCKTSVCELKMPTPIRRKHSFRKPWWRV